MQRPPIDFTQPNGATVKVAAAKVATPTSETRAELRIKLQRMALEREVARTEVMPDLIKSAVPKLPTKMVVQAKGLPPATLEPLDSPHVKLEIALTSPSSDASWTPLPSPPVRPDRHFESHHVGFTSGSDQIGEASEYVLQNVAAAWSCGQLFSCRCLDAEAHSTTSWVCQNDGLKVLFSG